MFFFSLSGLNMMITYDVCVSAAGHEHVPSWVWVAAGIFNFLAYTLGECSSCHPYVIVCVTFTQRFFLSLSFSLLWHCKRLRANSSNAVHSGCNWQWKALNNKFLLELNSRVIEGLQLRNWYICVFSPTCHKILVIHQQKTQPILYDLYEMCVLWIGLILDRNATVHFFLQTNFHMVFFLESVNAECFNVQMKQEQGCDSGKQECGCFHFKHLQHCWMKCGTRRNAFNPLFS